MDRKELLEQLNSLVNTLTNQELDRLITYLRDNIILRGEHIAVPFPTIENQWPTI